MLFVNRIEPDMPDNLPMATPFALFLMMLVCFSIVGAWIGVILRLAFGLPVLPPNTPRYVPWGAASVLASIVLYVGIQFAMVSLYAAVANPGPRDPKVATKELTPGEMMTLSAAQNIVVLTAVPLLLLVTCGARLRDFGVVREGFGTQMSRGVIAYPLLAPAVFGTMLVAILIWKKTNHPLENAILNDKSPGMVTILVLAGVVLAPLAEELMFRGILLGWLTRIALGKPRLSADEPTSLDQLVETSQAPYLPDPGPFEQTYQNPYTAPATSIQATLPIDDYRSSSRLFPLLLANIIVSLIFAAMHGPVWPTPIPIFFLSLGLGVLYQRTGSILPSIALHMTFNGVSTLLMLLTLGNPAPGTAPKVPAPAKTEVKVPATQPAEAKPKILAPIH